MSTLMTSAIIPSAGFYRLILLAGLFFRPVGAEIYITRALAGIVIGIILRASQTWKELQKLTSLSSAPLNWS